MRRYLTVVALLALLGDPACAQTYDARGGSPLELLATAPDGVAYFEAKLRTRQLLAAGSAGEAEPLAERLAREYPRDGENWMLLGHAKRLLGKYAEAAAAYERAGPLVGWSNPHLAGTHAAIAHVAAGNERAALDMLRAEVFERHNFFLRSRAYDMPQFQALRTHPEFLELVARPDLSAKTRAESLRWDIDHLYNEVKRVNPDYRDAPMPEEVTRRWQQLRAQAGAMTDEEVFIGLSAMLAPLRQGHHALFPPERNRYLPVHLYAFPEGVHVVGADAAHGQLIGARVLRIGGVSAVEILRRLAEVQSVDGDMQYVWGAPNLGSLYHLRGLGVVQRTDSVELEVEDRTGRTRRLAVATVAQGPPRKLGAVPGITPPAFLRRVGEAHWDSAMAGHDAHYIQLNQVTDDRDETLAAFGVRMRGVLARTQPGSVILDLRHNNGGDTSRYTELLRTLIAYSQQPDAQVYVLIGRSVYSAAANLITDLERLARPYFAGEASSECCNFYGDANRVLLPYTGIAAEVSSVKWNLSSNAFDARREMSPHVPVQLTAEAYFAGRDPVLEAVLELIRRRTAPRS